MAISYLLLVLRSKITMYGIINYDTEEIIYTANDKSLLEEILMDILEEDAYIIFLDEIYFNNYTNKNNIALAAKYNWENNWDYNFNYLDIIKLPEPID